MPRARVLRLFQRVWAWESPWPPFPAFLSEFSVLYLNLLIPSRRGVESAVSQLPSCCRRSREMDFVCLALRLRGSFQMLVVVIVIPWPRTVMGVVKLLRRCWTFPFHSAVAAGTSWLQEHISNTEPGGSAVTAVRGCALRSPAVPEPAAFAALVTPGRLALALQWLPTLWEPFCVCLIGPI